MRTIRFLFNKIVLFLFKDYVMDVLNRELSTQMSAIYQMTNWRRSETSFFIKSVCNDMYVYRGMLCEDFGETYDPISEQRINMINTMLVNLNQYYFDITGENISEVKLNDLPNEIKLVGVN